MRAKRRPLLNRQRWEYWRRIRKSVEEHGVGEIFFPTVMLS
jgi:hypothetical protein